MKKKPYLRYQCSECDYKTKIQGNFITHTKSIHENVKYQCNECDYKATLLAHLRRH